MVAAGKKSVLTNGLDGRDGLRGAGGVVLRDLGADRVDLFRIGGDERRVAVLLGTGAARGSDGWRLRLWRGGVARWRRRWRLRRRRGRCGGRRRLESATGFRGDEEERHGIRLVEHGGGGIVLLREHPVAEILFLLLRFVWSDVLGSGTVGGDRSECDPVPFGAVLEELELADAIRGGARLVAAQKEFLQRHARSGGPNLSEVKERGLGVERAVERFGKLLGDAVADDVRAVGGGGTDVRERGQLEAERLFADEPALEEELGRRKHADRHGEKPAVARVAR